MVCSVINVYMLVHFREKKDCWQSLLAIKDSKFGENFLGGDFNTILHYKEKRGGLIIKGPF